MALSTIDMIGLTAMGPQKYKNEQISVGHFCGKRAMGAKKNGKGPESFCRSAFFCGHRSTETKSFRQVATEKTRTYGTVHAFRSTIQKLPLRTRCAQGRPNNSNY